jgi:uncharacterized protein YkwD
LLAVLALATVTLIVLSRRDATAPRRARAVTEPAAVSQALGAQASRAPLAAPTATLAESMWVASMLISADHAAPRPSLGEVWQAVDALIKAGVLPAPPWARDQAQHAPPPLAQSAPPQAPLQELTVPAALPTVTATPRPAPPAAPSATPGLAKRSATPAKASTVAAGAGGWYDDAFTATVFAGVNKRRQSAGLQPLAVDPRLVDSAATYARVLADNTWFSHTGPDGSTLVTRDEAAGFPFTVQLGEVLAWGSNGWTAAAIVQAWIDSPAHRDQILNPAYTRAGAGCYFTNKGTLMVRCAMELAG